MKKDKLGQVFTPTIVVDKMINLISKGKNCKILEPSSGNGAFYKKLIKKGYKNVKAVEIDESIAHKEAIITNFFDFNEKEFDVIIGNPPYVDFKNIKKNIELNKITNIFSAKPNLYMFFFYACLKKLNKKGQLIFVMPTSWMHNTSCQKFNRWFMKRFKIIEINILPENIWNNASVTTGIFKIEHQNSKAKALDFKLTSNGKIVKKQNIKFNDLILDIKVGGASGNNSKFKTTNKAHTPFIDSVTERTKALTFYKYKGYENQWIRKVPNPPSNFKNQIFVNCKTRKEKPFYFMENNQFTLYDASVLCLYTSVDIKKTRLVVEKLNSIDWESLGIKRNGRFHFSQSLLKGILYG